MDQEPKSHVRLLVLEGDLPRSVLMELLKSALPSGLVLLGTKQEAEGEPSLEIPRMATEVVQKQRKKKTKPESTEIPSGETKLAEEVFWTELKSPIREILKKNGIPLTELTQMTPGDLQKVNGIGATRIGQIREALNKAGLPHKL